MGLRLDLDSPYRFATRHPAGYAAFAWISLFVLITIIGAYGPPVHVFADLRYLFGARREAGAKTGPALVVDLVLAFGVPTLGAVVVTRQLRRRDRKDASTPSVLSLETQAWLLGNDANSDDENRDD